MPQLDGFTAARRVKDEVGLAPIILMPTADGQESDVVRALSGGAYQSSVDVPSGNLRPGVAHAPRLYASDPRVDLP